MAKEAKSIESAATPSSAATRLGKVFERGFRRSIAALASGAAPGLLAAAGPLVWLACAPELPPTAAPERILLVTIDTLRADRLGCYGAGRAHTPHLDAIADGGVRFEAAMAPTPLTLPSHASMMTGLEPPRHGVRHNSIYSLERSHPTLAGELQKAGFATAAFVGSAVLDSRFGLAGGFDHYDDQVASGRVSGAIGFAERPADQVVDAALAWLEGAPDRFFLWVHFYDPHADHKPPKGFASAFASDPYAGEIAFVDYQLGRLLDGIRERWGASGLLVAATSDHGESLGEHREITHSYTLYDATQRIPLLLSGPGLPAGRSVAGLARLTDLAPTLLALVGLDPLAGADGRDLQPLIEGAESEPRNAYLETLATQLDHGWSPLLGIRTDRFKYIRAPTPELYDLIDDPQELRDIHAVAPDVAARMDRLLSARIGSAHAGASIPLTEEFRLRLQSLGYEVPALPADTERLGIVGGPDPKAEIEVLGEIAKAHAALSRGRADRALRLLSGLGDRGPAVAALRATAALAAGDPKAAEQDARSALRGQPNRPDLFLILGKSLAAQRRFADAVQAYESARQLDPSSSQAHNAIGRTLERQGMIGEAAEAYREARIANPANVEAGWRLAALLLEAGRADRGEAVLDELPASAAQSPAAALRLSRAEQSAGLLERALDRLRAAEKRDPGNLRLAREIEQLTARMADPGT